MKHSEIIDWLMAGDAAIAFQTQRDLLDQTNPSLQRKIASDPWAKTLLSHQNADTSWGQGFYQPKWISTHYTLLDLMGLQVDPTLEPAREAIDHILETEVRDDGGVGPGSEVRKSDVCVAGMFINYACYFGANEGKLTSIVDFILSQQLTDGGFNCQLNRSGATHSSVHSSLSILEGIESYARHGYTYRQADLLTAKADAWSFLLQHRLFKSDRTGRVINKQFLQLSYPARWKFNILRALDYWQSAQLPWDDRLSDAIEQLLAKRRSDGRWPKGSQHSGQSHLVMEPGRTAGRWNTLMALRVLKYQESLNADSVRTIPTKSVRLG